MHSIAIYQLVSETNGIAIRNTKQMNGSLAHATFVLLCTFGLAIDASLCKDSLSVLCSWRMLE